MFEVGMVVDVIHNYKSGKIQRHRAIIFSKDNALYQVLMLTDNSKSCEKIKRITPQSRLGMTLGAVKNSYLVFEEVREHKIKLISQANEETLNVIDEVTKSPTYPSLHEEAKVD